MQAGRRAATKAQPMPHDTGTPGVLRAGTAGPTPPAGSDGASGRAALTLERVALRLFDLSPDLLVTAGFDGRIKHANPAWTDQLGWSLDELRSRPYLEFMHPEDRERTLAEATALASGELETLDFELRFAHRSGDWRWLLFSAQAGVEEQLLYAVAKDITERRLHIVGDGEEAMRFLRQEGEYAVRPRPDLMLLDLNLPRKDGREVLAELKEDPELHRIPVIVLTTSAAEQDIVRSYDLQAACYITKPIDLDEFIAVVRSIESFWLSIVRLPPS